MNTKVLSIRHLGHKGMPPGVRRRRDGSRLLAGMLVRPWRILRHVSRTFLGVTLIAALVAGCGTTRPPVPAGVVPSQGNVLSEDERYGHEVLNSLTQTYPIDRSDANVLRVRAVVDRLVKAARSDHNPWHVYVLVGDSVKNAAATRGNFIFVWTGILTAVQNDGELATILAHEIGHVLAGHTADDPAEETQRIISGIAGAATGGILAQRGMGGPVADLAELIVRASLEAMIVNPGTQQKELEADQIGMFMMADAGFDPNLAVNFWDRVKGDPDFGATPFEFMSSHPSSETRLERLRENLPQAMGRYRGEVAPTSDLSPVPPAAPHRSRTARRPSEVWVAQEPRVNVYRHPEESSEVIATLTLHNEVTVTGTAGRWLEISAPHQGFVQGRELAPKE